MAQKQRVLTSNLIPGMIIAEDIYSLNGQMIVAKGNIVTDKLIVRLGFYSIRSVAIKVEEKSIEEVIPQAAQNTYSERIRKSKTFQKFEKDFSNTTTIFRELIGDLVEKELTEEAVLEMTGYATDLFESIENNLEVFDMLHSMRENDDSTYAHSINVALISSVIGRWMGFEKEDINILTMSGLFHDIGKIMIPKDILNKPAKLDEQEYDIIKTHTMQGYNILKSMDLDERVACSALMHHERCDGSGYPIGIEGSQINDFAKIVAIADVYDAMTSSRLYRAPICPFKVISIFEQEGLSLYDSKFVTVFLKKIVNTYVQNSVRLSNGQTGTVILINNLALSRPVVQLDNGGYIDLYRHPNITVEAII